MTLPLRRGKVGRRAVGMASAFIRLYRQPGFPMESPASLTSRDVRKLLKHTGAVWDGASDQFNRDTSQTSTYDVWRIPAKGRNMVQLTALCRAHGLSAEHGPFAGVGRALGESNAPRQTTHLSSEASRRRAKVRTAHHRGAVREHEAAHRTDTLWSRILRLTVGDGGAAYVAAQPAFPSEWPSTAAVLVTLRQRWPDIGRLWNAVHGASAAANRAAYVDGAPEKALAQLWAKRHQLLERWIAGELRHLPTFASATTSTMRDAALVNQAFAARRECAEPQPPIPSETRESLPNARRIAAQQAVREADQHEYRPASLNTYDTHTVGFYRREAIALRLWLGERTPLNHWQR